MDIRDAIKATNTAIATVDLVKDYGSGNNTVHALRGVNVAFEKGKFTAIMGPSGSGKSTLMHTLAGLDSATGGHIIFNGDDLTCMNDNQLTLLRRRDIDLAEIAEDRLVLTAENHTVIGGLGDAVAEVLMGKVNCKFHKIGVNDRFGQSGKAADVLREYGLTADQIAETVKANI